MKRIIGILCLAGALCAQDDFDLVVYGGTAGGVMTAVSGAREGLKRVALIEPGTHIGGMATGGLSRTDFGKKEVLGGLALEFYWRVGRKYDIQRYAQDVAWFYEPKVGEQVLKEMLDQAGVQVFLKHRLREKTGVEKSGTRVIALATENGRRFAGRMFADCSYEGDLMAQAGVAYTVGREPSAQYGESLAGVRDRTPYHQFLVKISPRGADGKLLPEVDPGPREAPGTGDKKVQAYNFRMILSEDPANSVAFPKPPNYDPHRYELFAHLLEAMTQKLGRPPVMQEVTLIARIPNQKADFNNQGAFSTDYIGKSWGYPDGDYATRKRIWEDHVNYTKGFFYFLANDSSVPEPLRKEARGWGLAKDEFTDNGNWPHQLYIREARRMVGEFVVTQRDLQTDLAKPDVIGMGSYNSDSHNIQRIATPDGAVENEGDMQVEVKPYQIPFRVLLPKRRASDKPAGAGLLLGQSRGLFLAAYGAAVHDPGPCGRCSRRDGAAERHRSSGSARSGIADQAQGAGSGLRVGASSRGSGVFPAAVSEVREGRREAVAAARRVMCEFTARTSRTSST